MTPTEERDYTPRPDKAVLNQLPIGNWPWPRIAVQVPMVQAMPHADQLFPHFWAIAQNGAPLLHRPYGRTDVVRNQGGETLLDSNYTHLLMLDSDQRHPPDIVQRLARWVIDDPDRLIVGGLYFRRGEPYDPLVWRYRDGKAEIMTDWQKGLIECDILGTGAVLIARQVFERLPRPWFWYDYSAIDDPGFTWPTEDIAFCLAARAAGIQIYCDTTIDSPHAFTGFVSERTYRSYRAMKEAQREKESQSTPAAVPA